MNYISIGVDPGSSSGAIAIIRDGNLQIHGMSRQTEQQIDRIFWEVLLDKGIQTQIFCVIEKVSSMPGQGSSSGFKFGMNYGFLRGCIVSNRIPFRDMIPRVWQKEFSMSKKKNEVEKEWKTRLLNVAQNLYPNVEIPLYAGDSVLLSHIARLIINQNSYEQRT